MSGVSTNQARLDRNKPKYSAVKGNDLYKNKPLGVQNRGPINRYGLQSVGKIVATRRIPPPAQLPSLKSENSGNDPNVFLVPLGGQGWGSKDSTNAATDGAGKPAAPAAAAAPAPAAAPAAPASGPRTWSGVTAGSATAPPWRPVRQSAGFQREFPSLAGDSEPPPPPPAAPPLAPAARLTSPAVAAVAATTTAAATPVAAENAVLSLRPTTAGSWARGGSRQTDANTASGQAAAAAAATVATASTAATAPSAERVVQPPAPAVAASRSAVSVPAGMMGPSFMPAFHDLMPAYMRPAGQTPPLSQPPRQATAAAANRASQPPPQQPPPPTTTTANSRGPERERPVNHRPIIKEEDLRSFDDLANRHKGWAAGINDIDYNKKLSFSDDDSESGDEREAATRPADRGQQRGADPSDWLGDGRQRSPPAARIVAALGGFPSGGGWLDGGRVDANGAARRRAADEETARHRQSDEVAAAVERARRRRQDEEARFERRRQEEAAGRGGPRYPRSAGPQEGRGAGPARHGALRDDVRLAQRQENRDGRGGIPSDWSRPNRRGGRGTPPDDRRRLEEPADELSEEEQYDYGTSWADQLEVEVSPALAALQGTNDRSAVRQAPAADRQDTKPTVTAVSEAAPAPAAAAVREKTTPSGDGEGDDGSRRKEQSGPYRSGPHDRLEEAERQWAAAGTASLRHGEPPSSDSERSKTSAGSEGSGEPPARHRRPDDGRVPQETDWTAARAAHSTQQQQQQQPPRPASEMVAASAPQQLHLAGARDSVGTISRQISDERGVTPDRAVYPPGAPPAADGVAIGVGRGRPLRAADERPRAGFDGTWQEPPPPPPALPAAEMNGEPVRRGRGAGRARDGRGRRRGARPGGEGEEVAGDRWSGRHEPLPPRFQRRRDAPPPEEESGWDVRPEPAQSGQDEYEDERLVHGAAMIRQGAADPTERADPADDELQSVGAMGDLRLDGADGRGECGEQESRRHRRDERQTRRAAEPAAAPRGKPHERSRQSKLPPRLARQRETGWLQRQAAGPHEMGMFGAPSAPPGAGWQPPIAPAVGSARPPVAVSCADPAAPGQRFNMRGLGTGFDGFDGASVPARTIIFENTNFKNSRCQPKPARSPPQQPGGEPRDMSAPSAGKRTPLELPLMFDGGDEARQIQLDFTFDQELSALSAGPPVPPPGVPMSRGTADLNMKIASVKKVWDTPAVPQPPRSGAEELANSGESADRVDRDDSGLGWEERPPAGLAFPASGSPGGPEPDTGGGPPGPTKPHAIRPGGARNGGPPAMSAVPGAVPSPEVLAAELVSGRRPLSQYELYGTPVDALSHYAYPEQPAPLAKPPAKADQPPAAFQPPPPPPLQFVQYGAPLLGQSVGSHLLGQHLMHGQQPPPPPPPGAGLFNGPQAAAYFQGMHPPEPHLQSFGGLQSFAGLQQLRAAAAAAAPWRSDAAAAVAAVAAAPGAGSRSPSSAGTPSPSPAAGVQPYPPPPPPPGTRGPARPPDTAAAARYQSPIRRPMTVPVGAGGRPNPSSAQQQKLREAALHQAQTFFRAGQQGGPPGGAMPTQRPPDSVADGSAPFPVQDDGAGGDRAARAGRYQRRDQPPPGVGSGGERRDQLR